MIGLAVKLILFPEQIEVELGVMLTDGTIELETIITIEFDPVVWVLIQFKLELNSQVITSLFESELEIKALELVPMFVPFFFH